MGDSYSEEGVRAFYETIGRSILEIEEMDIPEYRKERLYVLADEALRRHEDNRKNYLKLDMESGMLYKKLGDLALVLVEAEERLWEARRNLENRALFIEIFGVEPWEFSED